MSRNYQEKHKAYLDGLVRDKLNPSVRQEKPEQQSSRLSRLKRFACTLDIESKQDNKTGQE